MNQFTLFAKPSMFRRLSSALKPLFLLATILCLGYGLYLSLFSSPADYQQGEYVRIMYLHVPAAWISLGIYASMAIASFIALIWRHRLAEIYTLSAAPIGALFTLVCLLTGSLWGYPTWGTWWVWDARLTSVLVLFLLYIGYILLVRSFENQEQGLNAGSVLVILGSINLPIIKFSVEWWNTLHQPASLTSFRRMADPAIAPEMLKPLLMTAIGFFALTGLIILLNIESYLMKASQRRVNRAAN